MTIAWYGHLKFKHVGMIMAILISWGIAFFGLIDKKNDLIGGCLKPNPSLKQFLLMYLIHHPCHASVG